VAKFISKSIPTGWNAVICETSDCTTTSADSVDLNLSKSTSGSFYVHFITDGTIDSGYVKVHVYQIDTNGTRDFSNADTLSFGTNTKYSFSLKENQLKAFSLVSESVEAQSSVANQSNGSISVVIKRAEENIPSAWVSVLCVGNNCKGSNDDTLIVRLQKNVEKNYSVKFYTNSIPDSGNVVLNIYQIDNGKEITSNMETVIVIAKTALTGIVEFESRIEMDAYPVPFDNFIMLKLLPSSRGIINLYDISGRNIKTINKSDNSDLFVIPAQDLDEGIYFINFKSIDGKFGFRKIIKSN